uniref:uncharacterized protein n=1 Tax=Myxine glutinosa TaxID=7769 RepID=UPI00358E5409
MSTTSVMHKHLKSFHSKEARDCGMEKGMLNVTEITRHHRQIGNNPLALIRDRTTLLNSHSWEEDRLVLFECRRLGTSLRAFTTMASRLQGKNAVQVLTRYQELLRLFHLVKGEPGPACQYNSTSSEDGLSV